MKSTCVAMQASQGCTLASARHPAPVKAQVRFRSDFVQCRAPGAPLPPLPSDSRRTHPHVVQFAGRSLPGQSPGQARTRHLEVRDSGAMRLCHRASTPVSNVVGPQSLAGRPLVITLDFTSSAGYAWSTPLPPPPRACRGAGRRSSAQPTQATLARDSGLSEAAAVVSPPREALGPVPYPAPTPLKDWVDRFGDAPRKGSDILVQALEREGVDVLFAYPGGASMEIHQALTRSDSIRNILCRHEQVWVCSFLKRERGARGGRDEELETWGKRLWGMMVSGRLECGIDHGVILQEWGHDHVPQGRLDYHTSSVV